MRVYPAGGRERAARVELLRTGRAGGKIAVFADGANDPAVDEDAGISIHSVFALRRAPAARGTDGGLQQADVANQQHGSLLC
ncbi:hypothetical protein SDC9_192278 [bioreactor metagenome]|uniref:Uncharacterized protein n=1 Tax=bioreactor metagenome TaxID=1076179 RepID=A0A645IBB6_9ZZZZ